MPFYTFRNDAGHEIFPGFRAQFVHGGSMSFGSWEVKAGSELPENAHPQEQISLLLEGRCEFTMDGETRILEAGDVVVTPPNVKHSGRALTDCRVIDVFSPVREDYRR